MPQFENEYVTIAKMPTVYLNIRESIFRSYQILRKVKYLLDQGTSPEVVLGLIELLETMPISKEATDGE